MNSLEGSSSGRGDTPSFVGQASGLYRRSVATLVFCGMIGLSVSAGDLLLQFDDGFENWITVVAPELEKVGGTATCYVNNQALDSGKLSIDTLKTLHSKFGWEVGTHTYHHYDAKTRVMTHSLDAWLKEELQISLKDFTRRGFEVKSLAFPYNSQGPDLTVAIQPWVMSYRRSDAVGIFNKTGTDGGFPAASLDVAHYTPIQTLKGRIDFAQAENQTLSLYAHRVLPDNHYASLVIEKIENDRITFTTAAKLKSTESLVLVPDILRPVRRPAPFGLASFDGKYAVLSVAGSGKHLRPGSTVLIGPSYSTRLSDFRTLLNYAKGRLRFRTVSVALGHVDQNAPQKRQSSPADK